MKQVSSVILGFFLFRVSLVKKAFSSIPNKILRKRASIPVCSVDHQSENAAVQVRYQNPKEKKEQGGKEHGQFTETSLVKSIFKNKLTHLMKLLVHQVLRMLRLVRCQSGDEHMLGSVRRWTSDAHVHADTQWCSSSVACQIVRRRCTRMESSSFVIRLKEKNTINVALQILINQ